MREPSSPLRRAICIGISAALLLSGCSTLRTVRPATQPSAPAFGGARAGDNVSVVLTDGRRASFVVRGVEGDAIISTAGDRYTKADIQEITLKVFSAKRTVILGVSVVAGALLLAVLLSYGAATGSLAGGM